MTKEVEQGEDRPYLIDDPRVLTLMTSMSPHMNQLGISIESITPGECIFKQPYQKEFVGNPDTGVVHGGLITTLMDSACGLTVFSMMKEMVAIATLDLRIDYLRPAKPGQPIYGKGTCYKRTSDVAFVRGIAYDESEDDPIANTVGVFALTPGNNDIFKKFLSSQT